MKKVITLFVAFIAISFYASAQPCTPNAPTGNPGVFPTPDNVPCVERGVPYNFTMQTENFDTFSSPLGDVIVNFTRIDSIINFPCGITWQANKDSFARGETGCIDVSGTTVDIVGQYRLFMYMTMNATVPLFGVQQFSGELSDLQSQLEAIVGPLGYDFKYYSLVHNTGTTCTPRDTTTASLTSSGATCPPLSVDFTGNASICAGGTTAITANALYESGAVTYLWSDGSTTQTITVNAAGTYTVTITDNGGAASGSRLITDLPSVTADFISSPTVGTVAFSDQSTGGATAWSWSFGNGQTSAVQNPTYTYTANGTYDVTLIATNPCGTDTVTKQVTVVGVFISPIKTDNVSLSLYPNPNTGAFEIDLVSKDQAGDYTLRIFDLQGKTVYSEVLTISGNKVHKTLQLDLNSGIYTVNLNSISTSYIQKLVIY